MRRLVVTTLFVGLAVTTLPAQAVDADRRPATWTGLDVPYTQFKDDPGRYDVPRLRFRGTKVKWSFRDGILSTAATADSAIVMEWKYGDEGQEVEGPLLEVGADGTVGTVEKHALGIPLADPLGHTAYWTKRDKRRTRLVGYDTVTHTKVLGPYVKRGSRVFAVDRDRAYVLGEVLDDSTSTISWQAGEADVTVVTLPPSDDPDEGRLLVDVDQGRVLSLAAEDGPATLSDLDGNIIKTLPSVGLGTFSPDGRYVAYSTESRVKVLDLDTGTTVIPGLSKKQASLDYRWAPDGRLVLTVTKRDVWGDYYDDVNPVYRHVCSFPDASCARLPGRSAFYWEQMAESSAFGQLFTLFIAIGSRTGVAPSKALHAYLRQR
jgi:WD40 repeat protein